jgi:hypothetical protein
VRRLRSLTEAECYARCYGGWEATVQLVRIEPRRAGHEPEFSGEALRRLFEERLDSRELELADEAA